MKQSKASKGTRSEITTSRTDLMTRGNAPTPTKGAKRTVTFRVQYELKDGQPESVAQAAIIRASGAIAQAMEHGDIGSTGIKSGSVRVEVEHSK
jgi:hypothetical protein